MYCISEALNVKPYVITRISQKLVEQNLIKQVRETDDKRKVDIHITDKGKRLIDSITEHRRQDIASIIKDIAPNTTKELITSLKAFNRASEKLYPKDSLVWEL